MIAMSYGNVFVGSISLGANPMHAIRTIRAAESYRGTSLLIAFSHCINWGIDMQQGMGIQKDAVACGYWPLYSFDPRDESHPFQLASKKPEGAFKDFALKEARFRILDRSKPEDSARLLALGQQDIDKRYHFYEQLAGVDRAAAADGGRGRNRRQRRNQSQGFQGGGSMSVDLNTTYLGLKLKNPLVISACPLTAEIDQLRRLEQAGAAAAVLPSLFEEQIEHDAEEMGKVHEFHTDSFAESLTYFPEQEDYRTGPEEYLETIAEAKKAVRMPDHRQPQRRQPRRLGPLRQDDARRRGRRPGVEHLLRRRRPRT